MKKLLLILLALLFAGASYADITYEKVSDTTFKKVVSETTAKVTETVYSYKDLLVQKANMIDEVNCYVGETTKIADGRAAELTKKKAALTGIDALIQKAKELDVKEY